MKNPQGQWAYSSPQNERDSLLFENLESLSGFSAHPHKAVEIRHSAARKLLLDRCRQGERVDISKYKLHTCAQLEFLFLVFYTLRYLYF